MSDFDLTTFPPEYLDGFAAWAHTVDGTPGVEILTEAGPDGNAPHGTNDEDETAHRVSRPTSQLRALWAPHCQGPWGRVSLFGGGQVSVRASIIDAVRALDRCLATYRYSTRRADTGAYNCRKITGGSGYSLHAYGIALDINWSTNPYGKKLITDMPFAMVESVEAIRTRSGATVWRWGGRYSGNKDAMHFEIICTPVELASGIDAATLPGGAPPATSSTGAQGSAAVQSAQADDVDWGAVVTYVAAVRDRAGTILPLIQAAPDLDGSSPRGEHTRHWQQALNLVAQAGLSEDGVYGDKTIKAVLNFQQFLRVEGDFPGAAHEHTRWVMCIALKNLASG